jgi:superfamily I DNA/RNA helicase/CRISPR/Cas system-associated exonuclease Cas4 (RecB family)
MDERLLAEATGAAHQLLHNFRENHPSWKDDRTPLDELAAWLGLTIATFHPDDHPKGTYGFLEPAENLVWLCRNLSTGLQRFTLAHEIGHAILHRQAAHKHFSFHPSQSVAVLDRGASPEDPCNEHDVHEDATGLISQEQVGELLGIGMTYDPRSQREIAANIFAAELLMPLERVRALYVNRAAPAGELASVFGVSKSAMLNRLSALLTQHNSAIAPEPSLPDTLRGRPVSGLPARIHPDPAKKQYDEYQQAAIEAPTPALIVAGPGSGKTSTLIGRVEYLIEELGIAPEHILALTFSRKAAEEMRERLEGVLATQSTLPTVSTFHAFCAELLRTYGNLVGLRQDFACIDDAGGYFLLLRLADKLPLRHYQNLFTPTSHFPDFLKGISRAKDELVTPQAYKRLALRMLEQAANDEEIERAEKANEVADIYALYQAALERQGDSDLGGLIMLTVQLLQDHPEVRKELQQRYQHILVDEFQDMNRASGVLLRELAGDAQRVWVVGDANQAIYGFRGASPANIANFREDYNGAVVLPLSRNYRSRPDIVSFADAFRSKQLEPGSVQGTVQTARTSVTDAYVTLAVAPDESGELHGLVNDIRRKQAVGYDFRDMVVLCRTRAQARKISQALITANLPIIERGGLLEQEHIRNLLSIVMLVADASGMGLLRAARQPEHALTQRDIEALLQVAREQKVSPITLLMRDEAPITMSRDGRRSLALLANILGNLNLPQNVQDNWSLLAHYLFVETALAQSLLAATGDMEAQAVLADYAGILQLARTYDQQQQTLRFQQVEEAIARDEPAEARDVPPIHEQAREFLDYLRVLKTLQHDGGNRHQVVESDDGEAPNVIRVMTVHASKGLEFPVVYLPGIVKQRFPLQKRGKAVEPPTGMLPAECEGDAAHETGEACLFYVGATRARDQLVLSYAERYGKKNYKRSAYIDALVAGLPEERIRRVVWKEDEMVEGSQLGDDLLRDDRAEVGRVGIDRAGASPAPTSHVGDEEITNGLAWFNPVAVQPSERFIEAMRPAKLKLQALETYQGCPRQYMYSSIYGFRGEKSAFATFWQATQDTMQELQQKLEQNKGEEYRDGEPLTEEETRELYTQRWRELDGDTFPFATLYERHGHEVTELIRRKLLARGEANWQLRRNFTVDIAGKTIEIPVDRVEAPAQAGEPVKLVRTRFGKRREKPAATTREMLYARASRQHHPGHNIELYLHNMSTGETYPITLTEKKEQSLYNELEQAVLGLENNEFPAKPDVVKCPACPFFLICPA